MAFYSYIQNNSGGSFTGPASAVIIEATSADEANEIVQRHGVYFDDEYKIDCSCCGPRWTPVGFFREEGDETPVLYGGISIYDYLNGEYSFLEIVYWSFT
jgi:hypothetical protein